jgi:hypothetical protein
VYSAQNIKGVHAVSTHAQRSYDQKQQRDTGRQQQYIIFAFFYHAIAAFVIL